MRFGLIISKKHPHLQITFSLGSLMVAELPCQELRMIDLQVMASVRIVPSEILEVQNYKAYFETETH